MKLGIVERAHVSIIIPTYNSEKTLRECLTSVLNQTYHNHDIVIVDNNSMDQTLKIASEFPSKIIRESCNPAKARNIGISNSAGQYILFLDSDQIMSRSVVEDCVELCIRDGAGMITIPEFFIGKDFWSSCSAIWRNHYKSYEKSEVINHSTIYGEPRFFSKGVLAEAGGFQEDLLWGEDYDLYERLKRANVKEDSIQSRMYHCELSSARSILLKDLRYGKSMSTFIHHTQMEILPLMIRNAFSTFKVILKDSGASLSTVLGCVFLLSLRTFSLIIGLL